MCARLNEERVNFTEKEIKSAYQEVISRIESNSSKPKVLETKLKNNIGVTYS